MKKSRSVLYLTDLYYPAKGRNYYEEDLFVTSVLKDHFNLLIGHPRQVHFFLNFTDLIVIRNIGPVSYFKEYFQNFLKVVNKRNIPTYNSLNGKADILGKQYLVDLTRMNYPVIPTVDNPQDLDLIRNSHVSYVTKPKDGADSIGIEVIKHNELEKLQMNGSFVVQPYLKIHYEVSFFYLNDVFQYALYAPDQKKRWELKIYQPDKADLDFARQFVEWNHLRCGIQRVDACRLTDGRLLLVELEDLNPFLSIHALDAERRGSFMKNFKDAIAEEAVNIP